MADQRSKRPPPTRKATPDDRGDRGEQIRRWVTFLVGAGLLVYEAIAQKEPRIPLLILYGSMLGIPLMLGLDDLIGRGGKR